MGSAVRRAGARTPVTLMGVDSSEPRGNQPGQFPPFDVVEVVVDTKPGEQAIRELSAVTAESPIDAGRVALQDRRPRSSCPYDLNASTKAERAHALAWVRAWSNANPIPIWDDASDPDADAPMSGLGSASWRRARMTKEYVRTRCGSGIQVSSSCEPENLVALSLVIGRGGRVVFLGRMGSGGWGYTDDPDIARAGSDTWDNTAETMIIAMARAAELLENSPQ